MPCILFTVEHLYPFGDARQLLPLARGLVQQRWNVVIVVLGQPTFDAKPWQEAGVRIFFANGDDQTPLHTTRDALQVVSELRQIIRLVEPDRIHAWCGEAIWLTLLACQSWPMSRPFESFRLSATELQKREPKSFLRNWMESRVSASLELMVAPHHSVVDSVLEAGLSPDRFEVVANAWVRDSFVPLEAQALSEVGSVERQELRRVVREQYQVPLDAKIAVAIADLIPRHRLKDLIWAADLLLCIREDFYLLLIGKGPQQARLTKFASQTEVGDHVRFLGLPDRPECVLAASDMYWHSHLQHPLPCTLLSAMSMGIPAISVFGPETEAVVRQQETALATNYAARDEFARWAKFLLEQGQASVSLAYQGKRYVEDRFHGAAMVRRYSELFSQVPEIATR